MRACLAMMMAMLAIVGGARAEPVSRADSILHRLQHANAWRDHIMIAAHRAGWKEGGRARLPENSRAAIRNAVALGAEIVELDVRKSADGVLVVMHDSYLDRTTTCEGRVDQRRAAELALCRLVVEEGRAATDETVPTLAEMIAEARGRILVNVDNKLDLSVLPEIAAVVRDAGASGQVIVKQNVWNGERVDEARAVAARVADTLVFMPIVADDAVDDPAFVEKVSRAFGPMAMEMIAWRGEADAKLLGGPLFSPRMRAVASRGNWHMWINTHPIVNMPAGMLSAGRGDELAVLAGRPEEAYGFWIERGATIIQTDEPRAAIAWLEANGYRIPYDLTN